MEGFFRDYFTYVGKSEVPDIYHRWTAVSVVASVLGRQAWFSFGPQPIYPNLLILLQGQAAARKSTAIVYGNELLRKFGYKQFASDRMSRQTCLAEMYRINQPEFLGFTEEQIWDMVIDYPYEMTIHAKEFLDFIGQNDKDYLMLLTTLYDNLPEYSNPKLSSSNVIVPKPTINMIGAATPENLNMAFPPSAMDTGTLSRILFIHSDKSKTKMLIPDDPDKAALEALVLRLKEIKATVKGKMKLGEDAYTVLEHIYNSFEDLEDLRFQHYCGRRMSHLYKLCIIHAAIRCSTVIEVDDVLQANSMLAIAEFNMPKALGHFGRSRQSTLMHSVLEFLERQTEPMRVKDLYAHFITDFQSEKDFVETLLDLQNAKKLTGKQIPSKDNAHGVVVVKKKLADWLVPLLEQTQSCFTDQELATIGMTRK